MGTGEDLSTGTPPYEKCPIFRKVGRFGLKLGKISNGQAVPHPRHVGHLISNARMNLEVIASTLKCIDVKAALKCGQDVQVNTSHSSDSIERKGTKTIFPHKHLHATDQIRGPQTPGPYRWQRHEPGVLQAHHHSNLRPCITLGN